MTKKVFFVMVVSMLALAIGAVSVSAKNFQPRRVQDQRIEKMQQYSFLYKRTMNQTDESAQGITGTRGDAAPVSLGTRTSASPGAVIGLTYYELQRNGSMGRQVDWRYGPVIHQTWTYGADAGWETRLMGYNFYDPSSGVFGFGTTGTGLSGDRGGFGGLDVRDYGGLDYASSAVIAAHIERSSNLKTEAFYGDPDLSPSAFNSSRIPDALNATIGTDDVVWPIVEYLDNGTQYVTLIAAMMGYDDPTYPDEPPLVVFRKIGADEAGTWTATELDLIYAQTYSMSASRVSDDVTVSYLKAFPGDATGNINNVFYRTSNDQGATWNAAVQVTSYTNVVPGDGSTMYGAWLETHTLYDSSDNLHIIWNASVFDPVEQVGLRRSRVMHWSDAHGNITTVYNGEWDVLLTDCVGGSNVLTTAKVSISECDGNLYVIWQQTNDPDNGLLDDCGVAETAGSVGWSGNHDIYLSVSSSLSGISWDRPRNLTASYTPACDTAAGGVTGECDNDIFATMSRYGMDNTSFGATLDFANASQALTVDPSGSYAGDYYLDVLYVNDGFPGVSVYDTDGTFHGPPTRNDMKWFRLPCVDPVVVAVLNLSNDLISYPAYVQHGDDTTITVTMENNGNTGLILSAINLIEDSGPSGWLATDLTPQTIPASIGNTLDFTVTLNDGGLVNSPGTGTVVGLTGRVEIVSNDPNSPHYFEVDNFIVADTIVATVWDTVATGIVGLTVGSNGNMGNAGEGQVNLDFWGTVVECDDIQAPEDDTIPGDATIYLYDGSPIIMSAEIAGVDTTVTASWAIFQDGFETANGFKPIDDITAPEHFSTDDFDAFHSGTFLTVDSTVAVQKTWYAPTGDSNFVVQLLEIFSYDGLAHNDLVIGEAVDWDIPSDSGSRNIAGFSFTDDYLFMQGGEWNDASGDALECQDNDARFGGMAFIGWEEFSNPGTFNDETVYYGGFTALNEDFVYPTGSFVPLELFRNMHLNSGLAAVPSSTIDDQHMVMTFDPSYDLGATDTLSIYIVLATVANGTETDFANAISSGRDWYAANAPLPKNSSELSSGCCIGGAGNVNYDPADNVDISDLTKLVNHLFVTFETLPCPGEANTNGDASCNVDISDLTKLVNHLFVTFEALADCLPQCQTPAP